MSPHVGKKKKKNGNMQIKIGTEEPPQIDVPLSPLDSIAHVLGSFLNRPVKLTWTRWIYFWPR